jgi:hypothetical protein
MTYALAYCSKIITVAKGFVLQASDLLTSSQVGSYITNKYKTREEVTYNDKHTSLLQFGKSYSHKRLYITSLWLLSSIQVRTNLAHK